MLSGSEWVRLCADPASACNSKWSALSSAAVELWVKVLSPYQLWLVFI